MRNSPSQKIGRRFFGILIILMLSINSFSVLADELTNEIANNPALNADYTNAMKNLELASQGKYNFDYFKDFKALPKLVQQKIIRDNQYELLESFKKFSSDDRKNLIKEFPYDFATGFKNLVAQGTDKNHQKAGIDLAAEYFFKGKDGKFFIDDNNLKSSLIRSVGEKQGELLQSFVNLAFNGNNKDIEGLYKGFEDGTKPNLKEFKITDPNKDFKIEGLKLIGEKGGWINLEKGKGVGQLDSRVEKISYNNGEFQLTYGSGISLIHEQGTFDSLGRAIAPDGKLVSGNKDMSLIWGEVKENEKSIRRINYNNDGSAEIHLSGNLEQTALGFKDVYGNNYFIKSNEDNEKYKIEGIVKIDKNNVITVKSAKIITSGFGDYKTSNNQEIALLGNYFNEPGAGIKDLKSRATEIGRKAVALAAKEKIGDIQKELDDYVSKLEKIGTSLSKGDPISLLKAASSMKDLKSPFQVAEELGGKAIATVVALPLIGETAAFEKLSHPIYEEYDKAGKGYIYLNEVKNEVDKLVNFKEVRSGGPGYIAVDLNNFNGKLDWLSVNNYGNYADSNGNKEIVSVINGNLRMDFDNKETKLPTHYGYVGATIPIDRIINEQAKEASPYKIDFRYNDGYYGKLLYSLDKTGYDRSIQSTFINRRRGGLYAGGAVARDVPLDEKSYAGDNPDSRIDFEINPQLTYSRGFGVISGIMMKEAQKSSMPVSSITGQIQETFINDDEGLNKYIGEAGGFEAFDEKMKYVYKITSNPDLDPYKIIPGYNNQLRDMAYIWNNPQVFDNSIEAFENAGIISPGIGASIKSDGFYYNGQKIQGTDEHVSRLLVDAMSRKESEVKVYSNKPPEEPAYSGLSLREKIDQARKTSVWGAQTGYYSTQKTSQQVSQPTKYQLPQITPRCTTGKCQVY